MIEDNGSPLLKEDVNQKAYTNKIVQEVEFISNNNKSTTINETQKKEVPPTFDKPKIPLVSDDKVEEKSQDKELIEEQPPEPKKQTFVADDEDGVKSHNADEKTDIDENEVDKKTQSSTVEITPEIADIFGEVVTTAAGTYIPIGFTKFAQIPKRKIKFVIQKYKDRISDNDAKIILDFFEEQNIDIEESLKITPEEAELLKKTFIEFLKYKNIQAATPENAFYMQAGLIFVRLSITSFSLRKNMRSNFAELMETKFDIDIKN